MKRTFIKMLPFVAAVLLATSCSKDSNDDSNVAPDPVETQNVASPTESKTISFSITVNKNTLSKASLQESGLTQVFEEGDYLVIETGEQPVTLALTSGAGEETATFSNDNIPENALVSDKEYPIVLKHEGREDYGKPLTEVKADATSLKDAFEKYGYLTSTLDYDGKSSATIELVQNTAFIKVDLPFHGAKLSIKIGDGDPTDVILSNGKIFAVPNGAILNSAILGITNKEIDVLTKNANDKYTVVYNIRNKTVPDECINGVFSVASDKQVFFSKGNLRYKASNKSWAFADNQWDYIGNAPGNTTTTNRETQSDWIDLFGWGTWLDGSNVQKPYDAHSNHSLYVWGGKTVISPEWETLTQDEWEFLLNSRTTTSNIRYAMANVNGVNGLLILPDDWNESTYKLKNTNQSIAAHSDNTITSEWSTLQSAGAVFLPASPCRGDQCVVDGTYGIYWSSTNISAGQAYCLFFYNNNKVITNHNGGCGHGCSVRLVRSL